jgi:hypothetical protein
VPCVSRGSAHPESPLKSSSPRVTRRPAGWRPTDRQSGPCLHDRAFLPRSAPAPRRVAVGPAVASKHACRLKREPLLLRRHAGPPHCFLPRRRHHGCCSVNGSFPFILSPSSHPAPPWDPVEASPAARCPTSPQPHQNFRRRGGQRRAPPSCPAGPSNAPSDPPKRAIGEPRGLPHLLLPNPGRHLAGIRQGRRRPTS